MKEKLFDKEAEKKNPRFFCERMALRAPATPFLKRKCAMCPVSNAHERDLVTNPTPTNENLSRIGNI